MVIIQQRFIPTQAGVRRVLALARAMSENGESVRIIYLASSEGKICDEEIPNVTYEYWGDSLYKNNQFVGMISSAWKLLFHLPNDVIYYYGMNCLVMLLLLIANRKHTYFHEFTEYPGFIFGDSIWGRVKKRIHVWYMKKCYHVFVISKRLKEYCEVNGVPESQVTILNMFVDSSRFKNINKNTAEKYIAYCGNGENYKDGVDNLIESFSIIAKKRSDVKLKIVGVGPEKDREIQTSLIIANNLQKSVSLLGRISPEHVPDFLSNATILALARPENIQAAYGFPTKVGEYLSTGKPVVVTRVGELEDYLKDGESCLFAKPDSPEDFAEKLTWLLDHPVEGTNIGRNGKKVAETCFNSRHEVLKVLKLLKPLS